jgi:Cys-tRNA(Pro) deacylase
VFFLGYWRTEATRAKFTGDPDDWCRTGDRGGDGRRRLPLVPGAQRRRVQGAGYRIGPSEIENCLVKHPAVANAAVVPKPDAERGAVVKAYVVLAPGAGRARAGGSCSSTCAARLAPYEYPKEIEFIAALPMTTTGKVQRRVLRLQEERAPSSHPLHREEEEPPCQRDAGHAAAAPRRRRVHRAPVRLRRPWRHRRIGAPAGRDEHTVVKTLVMQDEKAQPLIVLMHGDRQVSTKNLAREIGCKSVEPCKPDVAQRHSGYLVGGTSPFGTRKAMPVYVEGSVLALPLIHINGGRRGFLVGISPAVLTTLLGARPVNCALVA